MLVHDIFPPKKIRKIIKEEVCGIKPYKTKKRKYFNIGSRVFIAIGIIFIIVFSFAEFSFEAIGKEKLRVKLYSSECIGDPKEAAETGWQKIENAEGEPDILSNGSIDSFFEGISASYKGGASSIICQAFDNPLSVANNKLKNTKNVGGDLSNISDSSWGIFQSAKIKFSFAIDDIEHRLAQMGIQINTGEDGDEDANQHRNTNQSKDNISVNLCERSDNNLCPSVSNIDTKIVIWRSLDGGETWHSLDKILTLPLSNFLNGGYFSYNAPFLKSWEDVGNLKIKFEGVIGGETDIVAYLDSVWIEVEYEKLSRTVLYSFDSDKKDFRADEEPEFELVGKVEELLEVKKLENRRKLMRKLKEAETEITVLNHQDGKIEMPIEIKDSKIKIKKPKDFKPGLYKLKVEYEQGGEIKILEQNFTWGVLAINTNKSIYVSDGDEVAYIQMAALRDDGHTICDASLILTIIDPEGKEIVFKTRSLNSELSRNVLDSNDDLWIERSGECGSNNVTDVPDYFAYYSFGVMHETDSKLVRETDAKPEIGEYQVKLTNLDNGYEINDSFEVRDSVPFDVERIGPTRIYPPADYEMIIKIKANQDFQGQIIENVPSDFEINNPLMFTNNKLIDTNISGDWQIFAKDDAIHTKNIIWQVDWKEGEMYELKYTFDAPNISPYLYLLGPLEFYQSELTIFTIENRSLYFSEIRQWQIAADAVERATIFYGEYGSMVPSYRIWDGTDLSSELYDGTMGMGVDIYWIVLKSGTTRDEKMLVVGIDDGDVYSSVWNGFSWTHKTLGTVILADGTRRGFDVAYETTSGDAMIVARSGNDIKYWVWNGSSWTVDGTVYDLTATSGAPHWIKLASDPGSDEISMIWLDGDNSEVAGAIWSGSAWGNQQVLESTNITSEMLGHDIITVEYEQSSGYAMFAWGADDSPDTTLCAVEWIQWTGSAWGSEGTPITIGLDTYPPFYLSLKPDPSESSDQLMLGVIDDALDFNTVRWTGSAWDSPVEQDASVETDTNRSGDIEWETATGHSGHAICVTNTGVDALITRHWDGTNWNTLFDTDPYAELTDQKIHQLRRTADDKIFLGMVDDASDLHVWKWNENLTSPNYGSWTTSGNGLGEIETDISGGLLYEAFMWASDIHEPDVTVSASGTQTSEVYQSTDDFELGGKFVIKHNTGSSTVTGIDIQEQGTVDAQNELSDVKLYYDLDTATPFDCADESYNAGSDPQFGTSTTFNGANGTASFTNTGITINQTQTMCVYVVFDVSTDATPGDTIEIQITDPLSDVTLSDLDTIIPGTVVAISGSTTIKAKVAEYTQRAYIWENDNGDEISSVDDNTQQAAGNTAITSVRKGERVTLRMHLDVDEKASSKDLALFYDRNDGIFTKVHDEIDAVTGSGSNCGSGASSNFDCDTVFDGDDGNDGSSSSIAFDPSGNAWVSFLDEAVNDNHTVVAKYVGTGGTGCGSGITAWQCTTAYDGSTFDGSHTSIAFDPSGNAWVSLHDDAADDGHVVVAQYVGTGGTGCGTGITDWNCTTAYDGDATYDGRYTSIAFDPSGNAWVSLWNDGIDGTIVAQYVGTGGQNCGTGASDAWDCTTAYDGDAGGDGQYTSIAFDPSGNAWVSLYDDGIDGTIVAKYVGTGGQNCGTGITDWDCTTAYDGDTEGDGQFTSIAFDPSGNAWVSFLDDGIDGTVVAKYVETGGTNCGTGITDWDCTTAYDGGSQWDGEHTSIAFDPSGNAWVSLWSDGINGTVVAKYVGTGGTNCGTGITDWNCFTAFDGDASFDGKYTSIAFDPSGNAWVSLWDADIRGTVVSKIHRSGEILNSPGLAGANNAAISESHADMTSTSDVTNRDDADCVDGTSAWVNGKWFESEEGLGGITASVGQCTETAFTIDTSQAVAGQTYRFIVSLQDPWRKDKSPWRGAESIVQYATLTIEDPTTTRTSKDNIAKFGTCGAGASSDWGCSIAYEGDTTLDGHYTSIAFDPSGNAWVSFLDDGIDGVVVAQYVGTGGTGCGGTITDWNCTTAYDGDTEYDGRYTSIAFDPSGNAWVSFHDYAVDDGHTVVAKYVGSGGTGCGGTITDWNCTTAYDGDTTNDGQFTSIAFDPSGNAWVSFRDAGIYGTVVAQYVGTGGTGCGGTITDWNCTTAFDGGDTDDGRYTSIAFDPSGNAWVSFHDYATDDGHTVVAQYVGTGGTGCGGTITDWNCTTAFDGDNYSDGRYTSIAFDPSGNAWVSLYDYASSDNHVIVAQYVGTGGTGCGGTITDWNCTIAFDGDAPSDGQYTSIAFDPSGNAWVSFLDDGVQGTVVAKYVGTGGIGCGAGASDVWNCTTAYDGGGSDGQHTSIAFDPSGNAWVSLTDADKSGIGIAKITAPHYKNDIRYLSDNDGQSDLAMDDATRDPITAQKDERPFYHITGRHTNNTDVPSVSWNGQSTTAPSLKAISLQVYRFGTTNAWENITPSTNTCSSTGANTDCDISGSPGNALSEYYEADGSNYWSYFRVLQEKDGINAETLKTDIFTVAAIDRSSSSSSTAYSFQRKTWYDGTRFWKAFNSGGAIKFWYSTDETNWILNDNASISVATNDFSIEADSLNAFIVYTNGYDVEVKHASTATSYPTTSFSWGSATTVYDGSSDTDEYEYPAITRDTSDKVWVTGIHHSSTDYIFKARQTSVANNVSAWQTAFDLDSSTNSNKYGTIVPLLTANMYAVWIDNATIEGKKYTSGITNWFSDYLYRKQININKRTGAGTNYQVKFLIGKTSNAEGEDFDLNTHVLDSFNDIRFTDNDETTELDYWLESVVDSGGTKLATVWVEVKDDLSGSGTHPIYIYYDKAGDSGNSNKSAVFTYNTYDFVGVTQDTNDYYAYEKYGASAFTNQDDTGNSEALNTDYDAIESTNNTRWITNYATTTGEYNSQLFKFYITEDESGVTGLDFLWEGFGETTSTYNTTFYAWDYDGSVWVQLSQVDFTAFTDQELTHSETTDPGKFIDTDKEVVLMTKTKEYVSNVKRVFVTSSIGTGRFSDWSETTQNGLAGGDEICQTLANAQSLGGTWTAWLSTSTTDAKNRITDQAYYLPDRETKVCDSLADLIDGTIDHAINQDETQKIWGVSEEYVLTGTNEWGTVETGNCCVDWTELSIDSGVIGEYVAMDKPWTFWGWGGCSYPEYRIYCFED